MKQQTHQLLHAMETKRVHPISPRNIGEHTYREKCKNKYGLSYFLGSNCLFLGYLCYFCKLNAGQGLKMILEWLEQHKEELMDNWEKAQKGDPLKKIEPLK